MRRKCNCNSSSVQANFVKSIMYVPLSTYCKCTNLQVVKALVCSAAQLRVKTVILQNLRVSSSKKRPTCTMRIRAEVSMFSKEAATRAPLQNMLRVFSILTPTLQQAA